MNSAAAAVAWLPSLLVPCFLALHFVFFLLYSASLLQIPTSRLNLDGGVACRIWFTSNAYTSQS